MCVFVGKVILQLIIYIVSSLCNDMMCQDFFVLIRQLKLILRHKNKIFISL